MKLGRAPAFISFLIVASLSWAALLYVESLVLPPGEVYLQEWTSEDLMQTIPIVALKNTPIHSLFYNHIEPPMLDGIRALLAQFVTAQTDVELLRGVDRLMYVVWALVFALLNGLIFLWLRRETGSVWFSAAAVLLWSMSPTPLFYVTLLEATFLTGFLVTWLLFESRLALKSQGSSLRLLCVLVLCFYTKNIFQWFFYPFFFACLFFGGAPRRQVWQVAIATTICISPLLLKQMMLFQTTSTSTFGGENKLGIIWYERNQENLREESRISEAVRLRFKYPAEADLYSGPPSDDDNLNRNYNSRRTALTHQVAEAVFLHQIVHYPLRSLSGLFRSFRMNFVQYWEKAPSQFSNGNRIIHSIPWRKSYNWLISGWRMFYALTAAAALWAAIVLRMPLSARRKILTETAGLLGIAGYVFLLSNLSNRRDWIESERLRMLLAPSYLVFLSWASWTASRWLICRGREVLSSKRPLAPSTPARG